VELFLLTHKTQNDATDAIKELTACVEYVERINEADFRCKHVLPTLTDTTALMKGLHELNAVDVPIPPLVHYKALVARLDEECSKMDLTDEVSRDS
jgi:hypothetical protein